MTPLPFITRLCVVVFPSWAPLIIIFCRAHYSFWPSWRFIQSSM